MQKNAYFLLNSNFQLLCLSQNKLTALPLISAKTPSFQDLLCHLAAIERDPALGNAVLRPFHVDKPSPFSGLQERLEVILRKEADSKYSLFDSQRRSLLLDFDGIGQWGRHKTPSQFRLLTLSELELLFWGMTQRWALSPQGPVVRTCPEFSDIDSVSFERFTLPFHEIFKIFQQARDTGEAVFNESWKIWRIVPYNPLIICEIFPENEIYPEAFIHSLESLLVRSHFEENLMIISSRSRLEILSLLTPQTLKAIQSLEKRQKFHFWEADFNKQRWQHRPEIFLNLTDFGQFHPLVFIRPNLLTQAHLCEVLPHLALLPEIYALDCPASFSQTELLAERTDILIIPNLFVHQPVLRGAAAYLADLAWKGTLSDETASFALSLALFRLEALGPSDFLESLTLRSDKEIPSPLSVKYLIHFPSTENQKEEMLKFTALSHQLTDLPN